MIHLYPQFLPGASLQDVLGWFKNTYSSFGLGIWLNALGPFLAKKIVPRVHLSHWLELLYSNRKLLMSFVCVRACVRVHAKLLLSGPTLCNPMDCSPPGSSVHEILQAGILECVALPYSRGSSRPRAWTHISHGPAFTGKFFTAELPGMLAYVIYLLKTNLWFLIIFKKKDLCVYCVKAVQTLSHTCFSESIFSSSPSCALYINHGKWHLRSVAPRGLCACSSCVGNIQALPPRAWLTCLPSSPVP